MAKAWAYKPKRLEPKSGITVREAIIPDKKTSSSYQIALESAVADLFYNGNEEKLLRVLNHAKESGRWPKYYRSIPIEDFRLMSSKGVFVKSARLSLYTGYIQLKFKDTSARVSSCEIKVTGNRIVSGQLREQLEKLSNVMKELDKLQRKLWISLFEVPKEIFSEGTFFKIDWKISKNDI